MEKINGLEDLSYREEQVFYLLAEGFNSSEAGGRLNLKQNTIAFYTGRIYKKLELKNQIELVIFYYKRLMAQTLKSPVRGESEADNDR